MGDGQSGVREPAKLGLCEVQSSRVNPPAFMRTLLLLVLSVYRRRIYAIPPGHRGAVARSSCAKAGMARQL